MIFLQKLRHSDVAQMTAATGEAQQQSAITDTAVKSVVHQRGFSCCLPASCISLLAYSLLLHFFFYTLLPSVYLPHEAIHASFPPFSSTPALLSRYRLGSHDMS